MAKKRPHAKEADETKRPNRTGVSLHLYVDPAIDAALQLYLDESEPQVSKTAAVESALRMLLREKGYWPPAEKKG